MTLRTLVTKAELLVILTIHWLHFHNLYMALLQCIFIFKVFIMPQIHRLRIVCFSLQMTKEYLQKSVKEHEDNIREMLAHRP